MRLHIEAHANQDQPIAFDLVAVRNKALALQLLKMTAAQWFEQREQLYGDYPGRDELEIRSWEWVPGQQVGELPVRLTMRPTNTFVFAKYALGGENRARIYPRQPVTIVLGEKKMTVTGFADAFVPGKLSALKN